MVIGTKNISTAEKRRLAAALAAAKAKTSARIALTVVYVSDKYPLYSMVYGALTGIAVLGAMALGWPDLPLRDAFTAALGTTIVATAALDWLPLRLKFIPWHAKLWECWELAHRSFAARILAQNDRKTGVLLFVSLGEHYVEVVTDRDVDRHIPQTVWDRVIGDFLVAAKDRRYGEGLVALVTAAGEILADDYPPPAPGA